MYYGPSMRFQLSSNGDIPLIMSRYLTCGDNCLIVNIAHVAARFGGGVEGAVEGICALRAVAGGKSNLSAVPPPE
jgi:hypothetical protein